MDQRREWWGEGEVPDTNFEIVPKFATWKKTTLSVYGSP
jgi:asparagine synthetase A